MKESWVPKNWCLWTVVLEKTLESTLDCKAIPLVHPKGGQSWIFIGRTDVEAAAPILWPPDAKNWLIWKDLDVGKDWGQEEKGMTEDEMVGWHQRLNGHGFGWTLGVGDGQGGLACCGSWGCKESDMTEWLNWTELAFSSVPLIYVSIFIIVGLKSGSLIPPALFFYLKITLAIWGLLWFYMNFQIILVLWKMAWAFC